LDLKATEPADIMSQINTFLSGISQKMKSWWTQWCAQVISQIVVKVEFVLPQGHRFGSASEFPYPEQSNFLPLILLICPSTGIFSGPVSVYSLDSQCTSCLPFHSKMTFCHEAFCESERKLNLLLNRQTNHFS
jgi:hypothetical protein